MAFNLADTHSDFSADAGFSLVSLRAFCEAARYMNFTTAAKALNISQSAISHRIKLLEEQLGVPLFIRENRRKISLTDEGRHLYEAVDSSFSTINHAIGEVVTGSFSKRIILGVLSSVATKWLIPRLSSFYQRHPDINLIIRAFNHTIDITQDNVEVALITRPRPQQNSRGLRWHLMWHERQFAVCSPDYLRKAEHPLKEVCDLSQHELLHDETEIASERGLDWNAWLSHFGTAKKNINLQSGRFFSQSDLVLQAAIAGHGVALSKTSLAMTDIKNGLLVNPLDTSAKTRSRCYFCGWKSSWHTTKIAKLRDWLKAEAEADMVI